MSERHKIDAARYLAELCDLEGACAPEAMRAHICVTAGLLAHQQGAEKAADILRAIAAALAPEIAREKRLSTPVRDLRSIALDVCDRHGITFDEMCGDRRVRDITTARHEFMALAYGTGRYSYPKIGQFLGGRDHTTIMHGVRKHRAKAACEHLRIGGKW